MCSTELYQLVLAGIALLLHIPVRQLRARLVSALSPARVSTSDPPSSSASSTPPSPKNSA